MLLIKIRIQNVFLRSKTPFTYKIIGFYRHVLRKIVRRTFRNWRT